MNPSVYFDLHKLNKHEYKKLVKMQNDSSLQGSENLAHVHRRRHGLAPTARRSPGPVQQVLQNAAEEDHDPGEVPSIFTFQS